MISAFDTPTVIDAPVMKRNARPAGVRPWVIVLHATDGGTALSTIDWQRHGRMPDGTPVQSSYHRIVEDDGRIYRCVPDELRAWHAGASRYKDRPNVNDFSLGLAWAVRNDGRERITPAAMDAALWQCADWCRRYGILASDITVHALIAPGRKSDVRPGQLDLEAFRARVRADLDLL